MNKIESLKQEIEQIKKEREKLIQKTKEVYNLDKCLQGYTYRFSSDYITYIFDHEFPNSKNLSKRKKNKQSIFAIMNNIQIGENYSFYNVPDYYFDRMRNPIETTYCYLSDMEEKDWLQIQKALELLCKYSRSYIMSRYKKILNNLQSKKETKKCSICFVSNPYEAQYCNSCGKPFNWVL